LFIVCTDFDVATKNEHLFGVTLVRFVYVRCVLVVAGFLVFICQLI